MPLATYLVVHCGNEAEFLDGLNVAGAKCVKIDGKPMFHVLMATAKHLTEHAAALRRSHRVRGAGWDCQEAETEHRQCMVNSFHLRSLAMGLAKASLPPTELAAVAQGQN